MINDLNKNIDCLFFESIIKGNNRPYLPKFDSEEELKKLNTITVSYKVTEKSIREWWYFFNVKSAKTVDYEFCKNDVLELLIDSKKATINFKIFKNEKSSTYLFKNIDVVRISDCWQLFNISFEEFDGFNYYYEDKLHFRFELEKELMVFSLERGDFPYYTESDKRYDDFLKSKNITSKHIAFYKYFERHFERIYRRGSDVMVFFDNDDLMKQYATKNLAFLLPLQDHAITLLQKFQNILLKDGEIQKYEYPYGNKRHLEISYEIFNAAVDFLVESIHFYISKLEDLSENKNSTKTSALFEAFLKKVDVGLSKNEIKYQIKIFEFSNINHIFDYINDALHDIKMHIRGTSMIISYYYLDEAINALFIEFAKPENYNEFNANLLLECSKRISILLYLYIDNKEEMEKGKNEGNEPFFVLMDQFINHKNKVDGFLHNIIDDFDVIHDYFHSYDNLAVPSVKNMEACNNHDNINGSEILPIIDVSAEDRKHIKGIVVPNSFSYKNFTRNPEGIIIAYEDLINDYIIGDLKDFKRIFSGEIPERKIIWKKTPTELSYFIKLLLFEYKVIDALKQKHWEITAKCFLDLNYQEIDPKKLHGLKKPAEKTAKFLDAVARRLI